MSRTPIALTLLLLGALLAGDDAAGEAAVRTRPDLVVVGVSVFDGDSSLPGSWDLEIRGDRIDALVPADPRRRRDAGVVVDGRGRWLSPGLVEVHRHLFLHHPDPATDAARADRRRRVLDELRRDLRHGITTERSVGDYATPVWALRDEVDSQPIFPSLLVVGPVLTAPGGHPGPTVCSGDAACKASLLREIDSRRRAAMVVAELVAHRVDAVKVVVGHGTLPALSTALLEAVVEAAHGEGLPVTVHTTSLEDARRAVLAGADGLEHGVLEGPIDDGFTELLLRRRVTYAPTLFALGMQTALPVTWSCWGRENFRRLLAAGVTMATGADFPADGLEVLGEMYAMVEAGASRRQALTAATSGAARHLGLAGEIGVVEAGARADLLVLDGSPVDDLEVLRRPAVVIRAGRLVSRGPGGAAGMTREEEGQ